MGVPYRSFGPDAGLGWWCVVVKVLDAPNLGYEHNVLTEMVDRLERDGYHMVADQYRAKALKAQEIYAHVADLGRFTNSMSGDYQGRGEALANELLNKGWTPPEFIPVDEVLESW